MINEWECAKRKFGGRKPDMLGECLCHISPTAYIANTLTPSFIFILLTLQKVLHAPLA